MLVSYTVRSTAYVLLPVLYFAMPAWADFQSGMDAYHQGHYAIALREWQSLAEQWQVKEAQFNLGFLYENGQGVPQDYLQARQWYAKAAAQGCADAQSRLGRLYEFGHGVTEDYVQAYKWYILGAAHGDKLGAELRDALAKRMTPAQIFQAQQRAREWKTIRK
jgi:uncharacterized protein